MKTNATFFLQLGNSPFDEQQIKQNLRLENGFVIKQNSIQLLLEQQTQVIITKQFTFAFVGKIFNQNLLNDTFEISKVEELKGTFALFIFNEKTLYFFLSLDGKIPAYLVRENNHIFITSQFAAFRKTDLINRSMVPIESYQYTYTENVTQKFSLFQNTEKIIPGILYEFSLDENSTQYKTSTFKSISATTQTHEKEKASQQLFHLLEDEIKQNAITEMPVAVALSGGVDSGTVLGFLSRCNKNVHSFSIGTTFGNEYESARISAVFSNSTHHEIFIDDADFWEGFLHSVFHNELCDPLYAEGYVAFFHFFKQASTYTSTFFTGYGADLVLGNIQHLTNEQDYKTINTNWCKRTSWTGELSPFVANSFNSQLHFPFWNEAMLNFGLSLPFSFIQEEERTKFLLRTMSANHQLTLPKIAWNTKIALTHGVSLDKLFSKVLNIPNENSYQFKSIFLYYLLEEFFIKDKEISDIDLVYLIQKTRNYVDKK
ncbi:MAG: asparagine synthase-related protein [Chitinophagales bacterium]